MKKKYNLWSFIAIVIAMLSFTTFTSCKDEEDIDENGWIKTYPSEEDYKPFNITDVMGEIKYDETTKTYRFIPNNTYDIYPYELGWEGSGIVISLSNSKEELKDNLGKCTISGVIEFKYLTYPKGKNPMGISIRHYSLKITSFNTNKAKIRSRSGNENDSIKCTTPAPEPPAWFFLRASDSYANFYEFGINVYVHIVRSSTGEGYTSSIVNTILTNLNRYYQGANISFKILGTDYIDNDKYNLMNDVEANSKDANGLFKVRSHDNCIDIYIISNGSNLTQTAGRAADIPSTAFLIKGPYYIDYVPSHEMGHCLGLYHTHNGTGDKNGTPELVNGSNSLTVGDYITDTPADPNKWSYGYYSGGNLTDANGDKYNPDPYNLMSYSHNNAQTQLTQKQKERIHGSITRTNALRKVTNKIVTASISGPDMINSSATYSINTTNDYDVTWKITIETFTSKTASTKTYLTALGKSFVLNNPNANATSQRYTITAYIKNKLGFTCQESKTAYHVIPSATTGTFKWSSELPGYSTYTKVGYLDPGKAGSYNTVSVYQNGDLYFYYTDACGVNTYNNSYFNFVLNDNYSNFTKYTGGYHAYKCKREAGTGSYTAILQVMAGSYSKLIPLNMQILKNPSSYDEEPKDSLETLKAKTISRYIKRI